MRKTAFILSSIAFSLIAGCTFMGSSQQWSYAGNNGPSHWAGISTDNAVCTSGKQQSPIDIKNIVTAKPENIKLHWSENADWELANNGHTIQVNTQNGGHILIGNVKYNLLQFHFHAPSVSSIILACLELNNRQWTVAVL